MLSSCGFRALSSSLVFSSILFPQIAFAIGVLTSRLGVGDRGISGFVAEGGCHLGCHW